MKLFGWFEGLEGGVNMVGLKGWREGEEGRVFFLSVLSRELLIILFTTNTYTHVINKST